jgi:hypothetical protein
LSISSPLGGRALGNRPTQSPSASAACTRFADAAGIAPALAADEDGAGALGEPTGKWPVADLALGDETRRRTPEIAKTSNQEMWLAATIAPLSPRAGGVPSTRVATPAMRSTFADHHATRSRRRAGLARGNTRRRINAPTAACASMRDQRSPARAAPRGS